MDDLLKKVLGLASNVKNTVKTGLSNLSGNVQAIANNDTRADFFRGLGHTINNPVQGRPSITQAIQMTAPTVAKDFGDMYRRGFVGNFFKPVNQKIQPVLNMTANTAEAVGSGVSGATMNLFDFFKNPTLPNAVKQGAGFAYNVAKPIAAGTPFFQAANAGTQLPQSGKFGWVPRFAAGAVRGQTGVESLAPDVKANKSLKIGSFEVDPAELPGQMLGFVKNPINSKLFKATEGLNPELVKNPLVNYVLVNGGRGALENIAMSLKDLPDNASPDQIAKFLAGEGAFGAVTEVGFRGGAEVLQKGAKDLGTMVRNLTPQQLVDTFKTIKQYIPQIEIAGKRQKMIEVAPATAQQRSRDILGRFADTAGMPFEQRIEALARSTKTNLAELPTRERKAVNEFRFKEGVNPKSEMPRFFPDPNDPTRMVRDPAQLKDFNKPKNPMQVNGVIPTFEKDEETGQMRVTGFIPIVPGMVKELENAIHSPEDAAKLIDEVGSLKPKTELLKQAEELMQKGAQALEENRAMASAAKDVRSSLSEGAAKASSLVKQIMSRNPELDADGIARKLSERMPGGMDSLLEAAATDSEDVAIQFALDVPNKADTIAHYPDEILQARELKKQAQQVTDLVYNSETDPALVDKVLKDNKKVLEQNAKNEAQAWTDEFFGQIEQQYGKLRSKAQFMRDTVDNAVNLIKTNTRSPGGQNVENMKDISGLNAQLRDVYRNFREAYGSNFAQVKQLVLDPFDRSKGESVDFQRTMLGQLKTQITDGLGIKKGSRESAAVQEFGEGRRDFASLVQEFGQPRAEQIKSADDYFRGTYDRLLDEINSVRARIYPNNPEKQIPKRSDYYRHFKDMGEGFQKLGNILTGDSNIASSLAGVSDNTKPKSMWQSIFQKRKGETATMDAVAGFLDYLPAASQAIYIDPHISTFRSIADELATLTEEGSENAGKVNNFIEYLRDFSDNLSGKTNAWDRPIQKLLGRKAFSAINWFNSRVKANVILGNLSSAVAQFGNVPQGVADAGVQNTAKGLARTVQSMFDDTAPIRQSDFLDERYFHGYDEFNSGLLDKTKDFAAWITGALDKVGSHVIWNSEYEKALAQGVENPIKFADDATRALVAGRGIGEMPLMQQSKFMGLVAPFQLEVGNLWHVMKDWTDEKTFGKFVTYAAAAYAFNKSAEAIRGSGVTFDPIDALIDGYQAFAEEDNKLVGATKFAGRVGGEVASNIPFVQNAAAAYPEYGFKVGETQFPTRADFFGDNDPTRFGTGLVAFQGLSDPIFKIVTPFGGAQIKKTIEGLTAFSKGYSESGAGRVRYPIEQNAGNLFQTAFFGQYAPGQARDYFNEKRTPLGEKQSETFKVLSQTDKGAANAFYDKTIQSRENEASKGQIGGVSTSMGGGMNPSKKEEPSLWGRIFGEKKSSVDEFAKAYEFEEFLQPNTRTGIDKYEFNKEKATTALKIYMGDGDYANMPEETRAEAIQRMGYNEAQMDYAKSTTYGADAKAQYLIELYNANEFKDRNEFVTSLLQGRVESITGDMLVDNGTVDQLYYAGYLTKKERTELKKYYYDQTGNPRMGTPGTEGGTGKSKAQKAYEKEIKKLRDEANDAVIKGLLKPPKLGSTADVQKASANAYRMDLPNINSKEYQTAAPQKVEIPTYQKFDLKDFFAQGDRGLNVDKAKALVNASRGAAPSATRKLKFGGSSAR